MNENKFELYVDMDGVLVDLDQGMQSLVGQPFSYEIEKIFWNRYKTLSTEQATKFWGTLGWTTDGRQLWAFVSNHNPMILSSPGRIPKEPTEHGKTYWIKRNLNPKPVKVIYETAKEQYAHQRAIIIDDRDKVINPWKEAGGIGIKHVTGQSSNTIAQLRELLGDN